MNGMLNRMSYAERRTSASRFVEARGLRHHLRMWGDETLVSAERPPLVMLHGWMDVGASFQFTVDALDALEGPARFVVAPDWRGFGDTDPSCDGSYWFADYLADLDAWLDAVLPGQRIDLVGHSMGGNVAMLYGGVRPERIRRLVDLEGFGMPAAPPDRAPAHYARWLDELKAPQRMMNYGGAEGVARRLRTSNPRLPAERADWLARRWAREGEGGRWHILGDANHKRTSPMLYRAEEAVACWRCIEAPVMWVEGDESRPDTWWGDRYPREEFEARLAAVGHLRREVIEGAGHMLHHDRPDALAALLADFLNG